MARPLRIEFPGALYHVTSRGDGREVIYLDDQDRTIFLTVLAQVCDRFNWECHSFCLMGNHYHLLIETPDANLSQGMRQLNGVYTQRFNRSHGRVGHVFQGRYKSILVQKESYLLELSRYVVLNPVRAGMVRSAKDWPWSSYRSTAGLASVPDWLQVDWLLSCFGAQKVQAIEKYREFVSGGKGQPKPWQNLRNQIFLGDEEFVEEMQRKLEDDKDLSEIPSSQRRTLPRPLTAYEADAANRNEGIVNAYRSGGYTMKAIAEFYGLHYSSVSKIIRVYGNS